MKSFNHECIKACSSMKVVLFHLQMMSIFYFTDSTVCSPTRSSQCQPLCAYTVIIYNGFYINIHNYYTFKNVFAHKFYYYAYDSHSISFHFLRIQMRMCNQIPRGSINEYTYQNGVQFEIKYFQLLRLSSFIVSEDIISILVDHYECDWNCARIIVIVQQIKK